MGNRLQNQNNPEKAYFELLILLYLNEIYFYVCSLQNQEAG